MASRFWVLGTGTWDAVTTTNWAASSGGAGGQTVPGSGDTVTFDGSSGGGTVTVNTTVTVTSITCGAFTGTLDFSANNNNVNLVSWNNSGSGTRTVNLGNGTWTLTGTGIFWNQLTTTGLTFNANSSVITATATTVSSRTFIPGASLTYSTLTISANSSQGVFLFNNPTTIATLNISAPNFLGFPSGSTITVTNAMSINGGGLSSWISFSTNTLGSTATISSANNGTFTYSIFREIAFTGGGTFAATNSIDQGHNSGITITAPSGGGGPVGQQLGM